MLSGWTRHGWVLSRGLGHGILELLSPIRLYDFDYWHCQWLLTRIIPHDPGRSLLFSHVLLVLVSALFSLPRPSHRDELAEQYKKGFLNT